MAVFVGIKWRRLMAKLDNHVLTDFIINSVFVTGIASMLPLMYTLLESMSCIRTVLDFAGNDISYYTECGGIIGPHLSISFIF